MKLKYDVVLASGSPRRRQLLEMLEIPFRVAATLDIDETYPDDLYAHDVAQFLANLKADAYVPLVRENELYITADTVVILHDRVIGKPHSLDEARRMLRALSGQTHQVVTGVCVFTAKWRESFNVTTEVVFGDLSDSEIDNYVTHYRPLDKAGAYGIQEPIGAIGVTAIHGSYYNVMGLPVQRLYQVLKSWL